MAYEQGIASDHIDLYNRLVAFLTGNADLVAAGQAWEIVWSHADVTTPYQPGVASEIMLRGPGLAGNDNVFVSMQLASNTSTDTHGFYLRGHDGVLDSAPRYHQHINSSGAVWTPLFRAETPYWFVANGRRFVVVLKATTVYEAAYAGLYRAYSTPEGLPYPLCVGGSAILGIRFSNDRPEHTHFVDPGPRGASEEGANAAFSNGATLRVRLPNGSWSAFRNNSSSASGCTYPWAGAGYTTDNFLERTKELLGGGYLLTPVVLTVSGSEARATLGALDGVFHVPGYGNAAENILTVGGVDHLVVQNAFRTGYEDFWALRLE